MSRILVTGLGVISAIGRNVSENRHALSNGQTGIGHMEGVETRYADLLPFGEIRISTEDLQSQLDAKEPGVTRTSLLALHAFNEAITDAQISKERLLESGTALIGATTVGGMCLTEELYHDANKKEDGSAYLSSYDCASVNLYLQQRFNIGGIINTISTACSSSANAILYGARLIKNGLAERVIVGGVDSLAKFTINGFNSLLILSSDKCRPFDNKRNGLNLGEGAAFLVLEKEDAAKGKKVYAELKGYYNANDAFHPSSLSDEGDGPFLSMQGALQSAELAPGDISFINAHGTGTENNDLTESKAMLRIFGDKVPLFTSTKSYTGHTLGAAGAVEAIYSILSLVNGEIYGALNFDEPIEGTGLQPVCSYRKVGLQHVMSNSFGFGGNCTSLVFSAA